MTEKYDMTTFCGTMGDSDLETSIIEAAHERSLSSDPLVAIQGRIAKEVLPAFSRWMDSELDARARDVDPVLVLQAVSGIAASMMLTIAKTLTQDERPASEAMQLLMLKQMVDEVLVAEAKELTMKLGIKP